MAELETISTPFKLQLRRMRYQLLPVVVFAMALFATFALLNQQRATPHTVGEVAVDRVDVVTNMNGTLLTLTDTPIQLYGHVREGQVIARLDDRAYAASVEAMAAETRALEKQLQKVAIEYQQGMVDRQFGQADEARRLAVDIEEHRLALIERHTMLETQNIVLKRVEEKLGRLEKLTLSGAETQFVVDDMRLQRDVALAEISGIEAAIAEIETQLDAARLRQAGLGSQGSDQLYSILAPLREAITAQEARVKQMQYQGESLYLRSPIDGQIAAIYAHPGQTLQAGTPIVAISGGKSSYIVSYVRESQNITPHKDMKVQITTRGTQPMSYEAKIDRIGPQVEAVPMHQLSSQQMQEWGRPVMIQVPDEFELTPGELVNITFK